MARTQQDRTVEEALLYFRTVLPAEGFRVVDGREMAPRRGKQEHFLVDPRPVGEPGEIWHYDPLTLRPPPPITNEPLADAPSSLFRTFAELPPEDDDILAFSNQYGLLKGETGVVIRGERSVFCGDPVSLWSDEVYDMREVLELWFALQGDDQAAIGERIRVTRRGRTLIATQVRQDGRKKGFARERTIVDLQDHRCDPAIAAALFIKKAVNQRLQDVTATLLLQQNASPPFELRLAPRNLLAALWMQLARAIDDNREYRRCRVCPKRIEISLNAGGSRSHRKYCSDACRRKSQREREDRARAMHEKGKSPKKIAEALGMRIQTVKKAIAKPKRPRGRPPKSARS